MLLTTVKILISSLVVLMAVRTVQSGTSTDLLLGSFLAVGLVVLLLVSVPAGTAWLLLGAAGYLVSQVLTSARLISRVLPILLGVLVVVLYMSNL